MSPEGQTSCTLAAPLFVLRLEAAEVGGGPHPGGLGTEQLPMICSPMQEGGWARPSSANIKSRSRNLCAETREAPGGRGPASQPR